MDSERPIEKLLREVVRARGHQAGEPPDLHPANRRLLQQEVQRCFPPAYRARWWKIFLSGGPMVRVAWAACLALFLGAAIWMIIPGKPPVTDLALKSVSTAAPQAKGAPPHGTSAPLPETAQPPALPMTENNAWSLGVSGTNALVAPSPVTRRRTVVPADESSSEDRFGFGVGDVPASSPPAESSEAITGREAKRLLRSMEPEPVPAATPSSRAAKSNNGLADTAASDVANQSLYFEARKGSSEEQLFAAPAQAGALVSTGSFGGFARSMSKTEGSQKLSQTVVNFRQTSPAARLTVLENFSLEQRGSTLYVNDQDGSVYKGAISTADQERDMDSRANTLAAPGRETQPQSSAAWFEVTGTNLTLNQMVRFSGQLTTNQVPHAGSQLDTSTRLQNQPLNQVRSNQALRQVLGEVRLQNAGSFKIQAIEVPE